MRSSILISVLMLMASWFFTLSAVDAQPVLSAGSESGGLGSTISIPIEISVANADGIVSWSFSLCHDELVLDPVAVASGTALQSLGTLGGPVAFEETVIIRNDLSGSESDGTVLSDVDPASDPGASQIVITDFTLTTPLPAGTYTIATVDYAAIGTGSSALDFCSTIAPMTGSFRITELSTSMGVLPSSPVSGSVLVTNSTSLVIPTDLRLTPAGQIDAPVRLSSPINAVNGFQFGITHDPLVVTPISAIVTPGLVAGPPAFFGTDVDPVNDDGVVVIALFAISPPFDTIAPGSDIEIVRVTYAAAVGAAPGDSSALTFSDELQPEPNSLPSLISVAFEFSTEVPSTAPGEIVIDEVFVRGEIDGSAGIGLPDAIALLQALFGPSMPTLTCADAADLDDNGSLGVSDVIALLNLLIGSAPMVPAPSPLDACGFDPTSDSLDCDSFIEALCP